MRGAAAGPTHARLSDARGRRCSEAARDCRLVPPAPPHRAAAPCRPTQPTHATWEPRQHRLRAQPRTQRTIEDLADRRGLPGQDDFASVTRGVPIRHRTTFGIDKWSRFLGVEVDDVTAQTSVGAVILGSQASSDREYGCKVPPKTRSSCAQNLTARQQKRDSTARQESSAAMRWVAISSSDSMELRFPTRMSCLRTWPSACQRRLTCLLSGSSWRVVWRLVMSIRSVLVSVSRCSSGARLLLRTVVVLFILLLEQPLPEADVLAKVPDSGV